jgi:hypothetical protein
VTLTIEATCYPASDKLPWMVVDVEGPFIAKSARRHHISDEDMLHAYRNPGPS